MEYFDTYDSPLGQISLVCDGEHLTAVFFAGQTYAEKYLSPSAMQSKFPVLEEAKFWLDQYFHGIVPESLPAVKLLGTPFQKKVWELLQQIPYGRTLTYGELAKKLGCKSAQAVGGAVGRNPISILIPCHRVMGANGNLTGYAGGIEKKAALLAMEAKNQTIP